MRPQWTVLIGLTGVAAVLVWRELPALRRYLKMARM
jgi:tryptophan-rich sensory protein